jgi:hypothetical protein
MQGTRHGAKADDGRVRHSSHSAEKTCDQYSSSAARAGGVVDAGFSITGDDRRLTTPTRSSHTLVRPRSPQRGDPWSSSTTARRRRARSASRRSTRHSASVARPAPSPGPESGTTGPPLRAEQAVAADESQASVGAESAPPSPLLLWKPSCRRRWSVASKRSSTRPLERPCTRPREQRLPDRVGGAYVMSLCTCQICGGGVGTSPPSGSPPTHAWTSARPAAAPPPALRPP